MKDIIIVGTSKAGFLHFKSYNKYYRIIIDGKREKMKVAVIGMGYVGLVTAISLAEVGNEIIAIEKNSTKLEKLKLGISPIYEPNIQEY